VLIHKKNPAQKSDATVPSKANDVPLPCQIRKTLLFNLAFMFSLKRNKAKLKGKSEMVVSLRCETENLNAKRKGSKAEKSNQD
jgi:hypothetical protein